MCAHPQSSFTASGPFLNAGNGSSLSWCVNDGRGKAARRSPRPTARRSATRTGCPTPSVTPTPNTCPAPWRQSTGERRRHTPTHTRKHTQATHSCASPRLLKAMGWQEYPENDDNFLPLTEDELREFQTKTEQVGPTMVCSAGQEGRKEVIHESTGLFNQSGHLGLVIPVALVFFNPHQSSLRSSLPITSVFFCS